jgi:hypothetical protein
MWWGKTVSAWWFVLGQDLKTSKEPAASCSWIDPAAGNNNVPAMFGHIESNEMGNYS